MEDLRIRKASSSNTTGRQLAVAGKHCTELQMYQDLSLDESQKCRIQNRILSGPNS